MIELNKVSFTYTGGERAAGVRNINLHIRRGEVVLLCGQSGCGKTTLTRLVNGLIPHYYEGQLEGEVRLDGQVSTDWPLYRTARQVGSVFQNPRSQFFNIDTNSEIVFGCENQGLPRQEIEQRLAVTIADFHMEHLQNRSLFALSGGEKQKIACAAASAGNPDIFVLDEPSSNLDVKTTLELSELIGHWKAQGKTILVAEHRMYYLRHLADRILYMEDGEITDEYTVQSLENLGEKRLQAMGLRPFCMNSLRLNQSTGQKPAGTVAVEGVAHTFAQTGHQLDIDRLELPQEGIIALCGHNGAGKTTLARVLTGLQKKSKGTLCHGAERFPKPKSRLNQVYMVMQDVNHQLFTESVLDEVLLSMQSPEETEAEEILASLNLLAMKDCHPMSLSGGQKQRVAIAGAIATNRPILIFDEPTSGLDLMHMEKVAALLQHLRQRGKTVLVITHDLELIYSCCDYVVHMEDGSVSDAYPLNQQTADRLHAFFFPAAQPHEEKAAPLKVPAATKLSASNWS